MYDVVIRYLYAATGLLILYLLSVRSLVNDILVGSLPGKYGKADKKAACIRESHRFIERMTQKYIGQFVTEKYRGDYHFYMFLKAGLVAYSHGEYAALGKVLGKFGYSVQKKRNK